ncbi:MAG: oligosaccharide flippase family protein [Kiloniellales bacterium]
MRLTPCRLSPFVRHLVAYGASEAAAKVSRLLVVVAVARTLDASAIGLAAAALAASEILKAFTENGVGQKIIAARADELAGVCKTARRIFWVWCLALFFLQLLIGSLAYAASGDLLFFLLFALLAGEYLFMPAGLVQCFLAMREGRLGATAAIGAGQIVFANLATAALTLVWPSALAMVLPKLLAAPLWLIAMRRLRPWRADPDAPAAPLRPFLRFGGAILGVEVVKALRAQADKLVIGALLGAEALGIYFFAFNAGLGIATSFSTAFATVLFPHLCAAGDRRATLRSALMLGLGLLTPVIVLQAFMAPLYVPLLFGERWADASDVVSILCLAAVPGLIWSAVAQWLRAHDMAGQEFRRSALIALLLILSTAALAPYGLVAIASGYLAIATIGQLAAAGPLLLNLFILRSKEA